MKTKFLVIAGDARQKDLCDLLKRKEKQVQYINDVTDMKALKEAASESENIILPIPLSKDGIHLYSDNEKLCITLEELFKCFTNENKIFSGGTNDSIEKTIEEKDVSFTDYSKREVFLLYNAHLTAQGTLKILLENTNEYLPEKRILITGFGRVAKATAALLTALGCDVYVAARKKLQRTQAELASCKAMKIEDINGTVYLFDYIINTIPEKIFSQYDVHCMKNSAVYIELASKPYGANYADFEKEKRAYISGSALPGRFFPKAAAKAIFNEII